MNIVQVNPIMSGRIIKTADIAALKLGVSSSDPHLFWNGCGEPTDILCDPGSQDRARQDLYSIVPLQHQTNADHFDGSYSATWTGISNPFGFQAGDNIPLKLEHAVWYYSNKGVVPLNTMTFKESSVLTDYWFSTFDRFGPSGTDAAAWGQLPNYPS